jgi:tetratricopeptide (TPR) repeat protein
VAALLASGVAVRSWLGERALAAGRSAQRRGDFNGAEAAYREASGRGNAEAAAERVRLELLRREWDAAGVSLREALALAPTSGLLQILLARLEIAHPGAWDDAREERVLGACRRAVALEPAQGPTWSGAAAVLLSLAAERRAAWEPGRTRSTAAEAADGFAKALALDPAAAKSLFGQVLDGGAEPPFLLDVAARRGDPLAYATLTGLLVDRARWDAAAPGLWAAAAERGVLPAFAAAASEALARRSRFKEGLAAAQRGLDAAPRDAVLLACAADSAARLPGLEALAAVPLYRAAVAADPGALAVRRRFAGFLAAQKLLGEAEAEAQAVVAADPKDAEAWFLLGEIVRRSGRGAAAAGAYRQAAGLRPQNAAYARAAAAAR